MPRYKVVLEFDHPGDGVPTKGGDTTCGPQRWVWQQILSDDATNISVEVFIKDEWKKIRG